MSITDTVLVFVGIPAVVVAAVYGLVYGGSAARGKRYRPGRKFTAQPVWFLAGGRPSRSSHADGHASAGAAGAGGSAIAGGTAVAGGPRAGELAARPDLAQVHYGETGGASDSW